MTPDPMNLIPQSPVIAHNRSNGRIVIDESRITSLEELQAAHVHPGRILAELRRQIQSNRRTAHLERLIRARPTTSKLIRHLMGRGVSRRDVKI